MHGRSFCAQAMRFVTHRVYAAGINPTIIEIKKSAHGDGVIDGFVCVPDGVKRFDVGRPNGSGILIHLPDKEKESFLAVRKL